ncbi:MULTISPECIES: hypothetical protein [Bosea]|uniref:Uncharacterized protein n=1 Tax=Bosea rubneri TaxID=3075434 RepID=A0ABU3SER5_9HYPH|nr:MULTISPECIES: hypothetical protein [unclassified Bosea (in: a-proteobacteria)]MDU0343278.1 hypothetical protein [Bosea sp. ZW T0_25]HEV7336724.1 hypothetical protein [Bosea sp. (in: a-proteobacteria)]
MIVNEAIMIGVGGRAPLTRQTTPCAVSRLPKVLVSDSKFQRVEIVTSRRIPGHFFILFFLLTALYETV